MVWRRHTGERRRRRETRQVGCHNNQQSDGCMQGGGDYIRGAAGTARRHEVAATTGEHTHYNKWEHSDLIHINIKRSAKNWQLVQVDP